MKGSLRDFALLRCRLECILHEVGFSKHIETKKESG